MSKIPSFLRLLHANSCVHIVIMVIMAVILENSGLLKAGPKTTEYQPLEGKTVKFSDVHGVDEVKEVREMPWFKGNGLSSK